MHNTNGSNWIRKSTRNAIYARDGFRCAYCQRAVKTTGRPFERATLDHVDPAVQGSAPSAVVTACRGCNTLKGLMSLTAFASYCADMGRAFDAARIVVQLAKPIDRAEGRRLAAQVAA